jgi:hypothetical protein
MLNLITAQHRFSNGVTRRNILQAGTLVVGGLTLRGSPQVGNAGVRIVRRIRAMPSKSRSFCCGRTAGRRTWKPTT